MNIFHRSIPAAAGLGAPQRIAGALALAALVSGADCLAQALKAEDEVLAENALELDRALAKAMVEKIERDAAAEFEARGSDFLAKAREVYALNKEKYRTSEQVNASHILFDTTKRDDAAALALAKEARARLAAGADFAKVAAEVSDDPTAKENGGALGWFAPGTMDPAFTKAAFALKNAGELSEPVKSSFGW